MASSLVVVMAAGIAAGLYVADVGLGSHAITAQGARCLLMQDSGKDYHSPRDCDHLAVVLAQKEGRERKTTIAVMTAVTAVTVVRQLPLAIRIIAPVRFTASMKLLLATLFLPGSRAWLVTTHEPVHKPLQYWLVPLLECYL